MQAIQLIYILSFLAVTLEAKCKRLDDASAIANFPYHASVEKFGQHTCSAAILNATVLITTSSCIYLAKPEDITVRVGTGQLESGGIVKPVKLIIPHNRYRVKQDYDIALIVLQQPLVFTSSVQPIKLEKFIPSPPKPCLNGTLTGFGFSGEDFTDVLQYRKVKMSVSSKCRNAYAPLFINITERMFCAELATKQVCRLDMGSPLVIDNVLVGLAAYEHKCGSSKYPGIYTYIGSNLRKWITSEVDI